MKDPLYVGQGVEVSWKPASWSWLGLLRQPDYLRLLTGQTISSLGSGVGGLALPLLAVLTLGASAVEMGLLRAASGAPALFLSLAAGVWVDRLRRRPVLVAADLGRAGLLAAIPLAAVLGVLRVELLYAVAFLVGALTVFSDIAFFAFVPAVAPRDRLVEANAKLRAGALTGRIVGSGAGGWLVQSIGAPVAVLVDALSFAVSGALIGSIKQPEPAPVPRAAGRNVWRQVVEGARPLWNEPALRATTLAAAVGALAGSMQNTVFLVYATEDIGVAPGVLGAVFASAAAAGAAGATFAGPLARWRGAGMGLVLGQSLVPAGSVLLPLASLVPAAAVPLFVAGHVLIAGGIVLYSVLVSSVRQELAAPDVLGRVEATRRFVVFGIQPAGALLGGLLGAAIGLAPCLLVAAGILVGSVVVLLCSPVARLRPSPGT